MARTWRLPAALAVALLLLGTAYPSGPPMAAAGEAERPCRELSRFPIPAREAAPVGASTAAVGPAITVPVIVHFMKTTDPRFAAQNDLHEVFGPALLGALFAPDGPPESGVNPIWRQANVRLVLRRVEECDYDPLRFEGDPPRHDQIPSPMAGVFGEALFSQINGTFNARDVRGLDLYLWMDIKGGLLGYGASHRRDSPARVGAVWLDKGCFTGSNPARCTRLVAHEIGHFLGLCHSCDTVLTQSGPCTVCLPDGATTAPSCADVPMDRLMRGTYDGPALTDCEITQARARAAERAGTP